MVRDGLSKETITEQKLERKEEASHEKFRGENVHNTKESKCKGFESENDFFVFLEQ